MNVTEAKEHLRVMLACPAASSGDREAVTAILERLEGFYALMEGARVLLGLEELRTDSNADVLAALETSMSAERMNGFIRGQRSALIASKKDPDEIPERAHDPALARDARISRLEKALEYLPIALAQHITIGRKTRWEDWEAIKGACAEALKP